LTACVAAALSACGGGGSSSDNTAVANGNLSDGLGERGELPGTVVVGDALDWAAQSGLGVIPLGAILVGDDGSTQYAWKAATSPDTYAVRWARSANGTSPSAAWSAATTLAAAPLNRYTTQLLLRGNASGQAVLGWMEGGYLDVNATGQLLRRDASTGWESTTLASTATALNGLGQAGWQLHLQADGTVVSGARTLFGGPGLSVTPGGATSTPATAFDNSLYAWVFAPFGPASQSGISVAVQDSGAGNDTQNVYVRVDSPVTHQSWASAAVTDLQFRRICRTGPQQANGIQVVANASRHAALAVWEADTSGSCSTPNLRLVHVSVADDLTTYTFRSKYYVNWSTTPLQVPRLAIDTQGRALALWCRDPNSGATRSGPPLAGCVWAQGGPTQAWTDEAALVANLGSLGTQDVNQAAVLAMNPNGQAVAALAILGPATSGGINPLLITSRFSFDGGWQAWATVANKLELSAYDVGINTSGQAMVGYTALDGLRQNGSVSQGLTVTPGASQVWLRAFVSRL
jgi:hypothetical protein